MGALIRSLKCNYPCMIKDIATLVTTVEEMQYTVLIPPMVPLKLIIGTSMFSTGNNTQQKEAPTKAHATLALDD